MEYICPVILYTYCIFAFYFAVTILCSPARRDYPHRLLVYMCIGSGIWSLGFAAMSLQSSPEYAYYCRAVGLIGTFLYLISAAFLVSSLSLTRKRYAYIFNGFSLLGIPICLLILDRGQSVYFPGPLGMTYSFVPGFANNAYTAYSALFAGCIFALSLYMIHSSASKRLRFFGKCFFGMVILMGVGTILDTMLPFFGIPAIPGSTLTQFWGLLLLYIAVHVNDRSQISVTNISSFIYSSISTPILVFDSTHRLRLANDAAAEFLELPPALLTQRNVSFTQLFRSEQSDIFSFSGTAASVDSLSLRNNRYCNLAISRIADRYRDVIGYVMVVTDLSERIRSMQKLEEAKLAAEAANRSKSSFLANMSHEIRTPMNAILGFSELLLKMELDYKAREYVSDIRISCRNLLAIINDILDISKLDSGKMELSCENFHLSPLLQDTFHITEVQARKKGLTFTMEVDPATPSELYGDKTRLRSILINILNNAVKYTPAGQVFFQVKVLEQTGSTVRMEYKISDTRIGLTKDAREHLFESFARFDGKRNNDIEGTGLGLAIVYGYIQLMGGNIDVDSTYGQGSAFTVTLTHKVTDSRPIGLLPAAAAEDEAAAPEKVTFRNAEVLVTDDNRINLKVIRDTLEYYGLSVDTASGGAEAIEKCRKKNYALVFMDQMMPVMDGVEAMRQIRALSPHYRRDGAAKLIVLTANAIAGVRNELIGEGFDEYLGKPVNLPELEHLLKHFLPYDEVSALPQQSGSDSALPALPSGIDVERGILQCGGDEVLFLDVLRLLHDSADEQLSRLTELLREEDRQNFIIHIHSIRGQLLNIGHAGLAEAARELEYTAVGERIKELDSRTADFIARYRDFLVELDRSLNRE